MTTRLSKSNIFGVHISDWITKYHVINICGNSNKNFSATLFKLDIKNDQWLNWQITPHLSFRWGSIPRLGLLPTVFKKAFVKLILVAEQYSSTARTGPHHCGHKTWHWHAVLGLACSAWALLSTARVLWLKHCFQCCHWPQWCPGHCPGSLSWVTVLGHCQALPYESATASVKGLYQCRKFRSSAPSTACQCSHSLS